MKLNPVGLIIPNQTDMKIYSHCKFRFSYNLACVNTYEVEIVPTGLKCKYKRWITASLDSKLTN